MTAAFQNRITLAALACLLSTSAAAQVKTDGQWRGTGGAALSASAGNTSSTALSLNAEMVRATASDKITLGASSQYARSKSAGVSSTTANKWGGSGQYDYNLSPQWFAFGKLGLEGDELIHLTLRGTLAGGVGYKFINTPETSFNVFGGAAYSTDRYDTPQTIGSESGTRFSRASLYLGEESSHTVSSSTSFKQRLELYPGLSGDKAFMAKFTAGLAVAVSGTLNLSVGLVDTYNSRPPAGNKKNDVGLFTGLNLKFGAP